MPLTLVEGETNVHTFSHNHICPTSLTKGQSLDLYSDLSQRATLGLNVSDVAQAEVKM